MEALLGGAGILYALLGIGFVIFIHELGHFLLAKKAGVKVQTFSIGFGPVVWAKRVGETDYQLSLLPFGGFVAMEEGTPDEEGTYPDHSLNAQSKGWQAAILAAGVIFNLISSYVVLLLLAWTGMPQMPAVVGSVAPEVYDQDGTAHESPRFRSRFVAW